VIDTTTFIWGSDAYFPIPVSLLSPDGSQRYRDFRFRSQDRGRTGSARRGDFLFAMVGEIDVTGLSLASLLSLATTNSKW
jgi:hypothetical protein